MPTKKAKRGRKPYDLNTMVSIIPKAIRDKYPDKEGALELLKQHELSVLADQMGGELTEEEIRPQLLKRINQDLKRLDLHYVHYIADGGVDKAAQVVMVKIKMMIQMYTGLNMNGARSLIKALSYNAGDQEQADEQASQMSDEELENLAKAKEEE